MKKIKIFGLMAAVLMGAIFTGCDPETRENLIFKNYVFLSSPAAADGQFYDQWLDPDTEDGIDLNFNVILKGSSLSDITVTLSADESLLDAYNTVHGTSYDAIPRDKLSFAGEAVSDDGDVITVIIPAGESSVPVSVHMERMDDWENVMPRMENFYFIVAITDVANTEDDVLASTTNRTELVCPVKLLSDWWTEPEDLPYIDNTIPANRNAPSFSFRGEGAGNTAMTTLHNASTSWGAHFVDFTIEGWVRHDVQVTQANCQWFFNTADGQSGGGGANTQPEPKDEFFVRWGDARNVDNRKNYMEVKAFNGSQDNTPADWAGARWYHVSFVYTRATNKIIIYRDGEHYYELNYPDPMWTEGGAKVCFPGIGFVGSNGTKIPKLAMCDFRMWNVARTASQVKKAYNHRVDPAEPNLVAYWPLDGQAGDSAPTTFTNLVTGEPRGGIPTAGDLKVNSGAFDSWVPITFPADAPVAP